VNEPIGVQTSLPADPKAEDKSVGAPETALSANAVTLRAPAAGKDEADLEVVSQGAAAGGASPSADEAMITDRWNLTPVQLGLSKPVPFRPEARIEIDKLREMLRPWYFTENLRVLQAGLQMSRIMNWHSELHNQLVETSLEKVWSLLASLRGGAETHNRKIVVVLEGGIFLALQQCPEEGKGTCSNHLRFLIALCHERCIRELKAVFSETKDLEIWRFYSLIAGRIVSLFPEGSEIRKIYHQELKIQLVQCGQNVLNPALTYSESIAHVKMVRNAFQLLMQKEETIGKEVSERFNQACHEYLIRQVNRACQSFPEGGSALPSSLPNLSPGGCLNPPSLSPGRGLQAKQRANSSEKDPSVALGPKVGTS
jgi:hypothetical protein